MDVDEVAKKKEGVVGVNPHVVCRLPSASWRSFLLAGRGECDRRMAFDGLQCLVLLADAFPRLAGQRDLDTFTFALVSAFARDSE